MPLLRCSCGTYTTKPPVRYFVDDHYDETIICGRCRKRTPIMKAIEQSLVNGRRYELLKAKDANKDTREQGTDGQGDPILDPEPESA